MVVHRWPRLLGRWPSRAGPVEADPDGPAIVIAFDTPVVGQAAHDVEPVAAVSVQDPQAWAARGGLKNPLEAGCQRSHTAAARASQAAANSAVAP